MQHICLKCQGPIPVVDEVETGLSPARKVSLMADAATLEQLQGDLWYIKSALADAILDTIEAELIPDDLERATLRLKLDSSRFTCDDPARVKLAGTRLLQYIENIAKHAHKVSGDEVIAKWFGTSDSDRRISLEVLSRMANPDKESNALQSAQQVASSLFHYWEFDVTSMRRRLTIEDAKEFCNTWYPLHEEPELGKENTAPEQLSSIAKRFIDKLGAGLRSDESLFPDERMFREEVGDESYFTE